MRSLKGLGVTLLGIWLLVTGAVSLLHLHMAYLSSITDLLALAAGILILLRR